MNPISLIGVGRMGLPVGKHLLRAGHSVSAFDTSREAARRASAAGINVEQDVAGACLPSDVILVFVPGQAVDAVLLDPDGKLNDWLRGKVVVVCSTMAPSAVRELGRVLVDEEITLVDAPLCKGEQAAVDGKLLVLCGCEPEVFDRVAPVFGAFASDSCRLGPLGSGQAGKLINNFLLWSAVTSVAEGLDLAKALGLSEADLRDALGKSSGQSWALDTWERPRSMPWADEDMRMVLEESNRARLSLPLAGLVHEEVKAVREKRSAGG